MMNCKYYAGIGSRQTPSWICEKMSKLASYLEYKGYVLRSGGADGADIAFEKGVKNSKNKKIYIPANNFNGRSEYQDGVYNCKKIKSDIQDKARTIMLQNHPNPSRLKEYATMLLTRDVYQVIGENLDEKADFIVCWTKDAKPIGGTSQAIRLANIYKIPILNLGHIKSVDDFDKNTPFLNDLIMKLMNNQIEIDTNNVDVIKLCK